MSKCCRTAHFYHKQDVYKDKAKLSSNEHCDITLNYPNGKEIVLDNCTKTSSGLVPGVEVIANANKIAVLGKEKESAPVVDGVIVEK